MIQVPELSKLLGTAQFLAPWCPHPCTAGALDLPQSLQQMPRAAGDGGRRITLWTMQRASAELEAEDLHCSPKSLVSSWSSPHCEKLAVEGFTPQPIPRALVQFSTL